MVGRQVHSHLSSLATVETHVSSTHNYHTIIDLDKSKGFALRFPQILYYKLINASQNDLSNGVFCDSIWHLL